MAAPKKKSKYPRLAKAPLIGGLFEEPDPTQVQANTAFLPGMGPMMNVLSAGAGKASRAARQFDALTPPKPPMAGPQLPSMGQTALKAAQAGDPATADALYSAGQGPMRSLAPFERLARGWERPPLQLPPGGSGPASSYFRGSMPELPPAATSGAGMTPLSAPAAPPQWRLPAGPTPPGLPNPARAALPPGRPYAPPAPPQAPTNVLPSSGTPMRGYPGQPPQMRELFPSFEQRLAAMKAKPPAPATPPAPPAAPAVPSPGAAAPPGPPIGPRMPPLNAKPPLVNPRSAPGPEPLGAALGRAAPAGMERVGLGAGAAIGAGLGASSALDPAPPPPGRGPSNRNYWIPGATNAQMGLLPQLFAEKMLGEDPAQRMMGQPPAPLAPAVAPPRPPATPPSPPPTVAGSFGPSAAPFDFAADNGGAPSPGPDQARRASPTPPRGPGRGRRAEAPVAAPPSRIDSLATELAASTSRGPAQAQAWDRMQMAGPAITERMAPAFMPGANKLSMPFAGARTPGGLGLPSSVAEIAPEEETDERGVRKSKNRRAQMSLAQRLMASIAG